MKKYYVYVLRNQDDKIVYVGCTENPKTRLNFHTCKNGKFYQCDVDMEIIKKFTDKNEALLFEGNFKKKLGFEWTEHTRGIKGGKKGGPISGKLHFENKTGLFNPKNQQKVLEGKIKGLEKGRETIKEKYSKPLLVFNLNGQFITKYYSQREAARELNLDRANIRACLKGKYTQTGGYIFKNA